jgi:hypothetical protein
MMLNPNIMCTSRGLKARYKLPLPARKTENGDTIQQAKYPEKAAINIFAARGFEDADCPSATSNIDDHR